MSSTKIPTSQIYYTLHELVADVIAKHEQGYTIDEFNYPQLVGWTFHVNYFMPETKQEEAKVSVEVKAPVGRPKQGAK